MTLSYSLLFTSPLYDDEIFNIHYAVVCTRLNINSSQTNVSLVWCIDYMNEVESEREIPHLTGEYEFFVLEVVGDQRRNMTFSHHFKD